MIKILLILLMAVSVSAQTWHENNGKREWAHNRTRIMVSNDLEIVSWPGLPDSTYFKVGIGLPTDSIWYSGDTTTLRLSEYYDARFYNTVDNRLEWEAVLYQKPGNQYSWTFPMESNNLVFYYQAELTQEEIDREAVRPDSVIGSYAVYHTSNKNNEYKTGKALHIYRPKAWDSAGDTVWIGLDIDTVTNELTIAGTRPWFRDAVYPVTIDPTIGKTDIGGSGTVSPYFWANSGTIGAVGGTIDSYHVYHRTTSALWLRGGVYDSTGGSGYPGNLLTNGASDSTFTNAIEWVVSTFPTDPSVNANEKYWFAFLSSTTMSFSFDGGPDNSAREDVGMTWPTFDDPATTDNGYTIIASHYLTYTTAGAGAYRGTIISVIGGN